VFGDFVEHLGHVRFFLGGIGASIGFARAAGKKGECGAGREGGESVAARDGQSGHGSGVSIISRNAVVRANGLD
jgi:hypothetical protein